MKSNKVSILLGVLSVCTMAYGSREFAINEVQNGTLGVTVANFSKELFSTKTQADEVVTIAKPVSEAVLMVDKDGNIKDSANKTTEELAPLVAPKTEVTLAPEAAPVAPVATTPVVKEAPKQEAPKQEAPKQEAPKQEAPKQEAPKQVTQAPKAQQSVQAQEPAAPNYPAGSVRDIVKQAAAKRGWASGANWAAIDFIVQHESSWNPNAKNPSSSAYGLFQMLVERNSNPAVQAENGMNYIAGRYGTPSQALAFWKSHHWY